MIESECFLPRWVGGASGSTPERCASPCGGLKKVAMNSDLPLADVGFHGAILNLVSISIAQRTCEIDLCLGDWKVGKPRPASLFAFTDMASFFGRFDFQELADNARAGNVQDGAVDAAGTRLRMHLVGGMLEAVAGTIGLRALGCSHAGRGSTAFADGRRPRPDAGAELTSLEPLDRVDLDLSHLEEIQLSAVDSICRLVMQVRTSSNVLQRAPATITFKGVTSCVVHLDIEKLAAERPYGNVIGGHVDVARGLVRLHLSEGFIEIGGRSASLVWR